MSKPVNPPPSCHYLAASFQPCWILLCLAFFLTLKARPNPNNINTDLEQFKKGLLQLPTTAGAMQIFSTLMLPVLQSLINCCISPVHTDTAPKQEFLRKSFYSLNMHAEAHVCQCLHILMLCTYILQLFQIEWILF